jgi:predicted O-methyltransferase YrrM
MKIRKKVMIKTRLMMPNFYFGEQLSEFFLDHIKPHRYFDKWSIQPFNGQSKRMSVIWQIAKDFNPTLGIETGTFLGSSTPYLASMVSGEMYTIEIEEQTALLAKERFEKNHKSSKIILVVGDSVEKISEI